MSSKLSSKCPVLGNLITNKSSIREQALALRKLHLYQQIELYQESVPEIVKYEKEGVTYYSRRLIKDFQRFLHSKFTQEWLPGKKFISTVSIALRFNELELMTWCFIVYLFLIEDRIFYSQLR